MTAAALNVPLLVFYGREFCRHAGVLKESLACYVLLLFVKVKRAFDDALCGFVHFFLPFRGAFSDDEAQSPYFGTPLMLLLFCSLF